MWRRRCFHGINAMILMPQIFDVTANENARYKRNELECLIFALTCSHNKHQWQWKSLGCFLPAGRPSGLGCVAVALAEDRGVGVELEEFITDPPARLDSEATPPGGYRKKDNSVTLGFKIMKTNFRRCIWV